MKIDWKYLFLAIGSAAILYALYVVAFERDTDISVWAFLLLWLGGGMLFLHGVVGSLLGAVFNKNVLKASRDYTDNGKSLKEMNAERRARVEAARREGRL